MELGKGRVGSFTGGFGGRKKKKELVLFYFFTKTLLLLSRLITSIRRLSFKEKNQAIVS